ncbi:acyl-CoA dehydrogenase family protein [Nitriliruptor alkaliphilus]|uniref:acyl-CoA dehydrogenase family protein n=1 Tax=Nitriliruptor alkaliphilus TaxID=427918 RepID=UPI0006979B8A|nr:acyl-CoA dehydrogenase family protein [Nitriliruptor alkaliphilus]
MSTVTFTVTDEQQLLRDTVRDALRKRATSARVREVMQTDQAVDEDGWRELAELGLVGLLVPESDGGSGAGVVEAAIVAEELGRVLLPVPYLSSAVLAPTVLAVAADADQKAAVLPGIAAGTTVATVAHLDPAGRLAADPGVRAVRDGDDWVLDGEAGFVLDGLRADTIVTAATTDDGLALFLVASDATGLGRERVPVLDLTRPMATVRYDGVRVAGSDRLAGGDATVALHRGLATANAVLVNEQVGGAAQCLEDATVYAKERIQFGRAIGSFQAVKHKLAETLVKVESARSTAYHAAQVVAAEEARESAVAVPLAAAFCSEVYETASADALQIFGGIGFTWEHDIHLYFKRAKASKLLLGSPRHHRRILGDVLGL